MGMLLAMQLSSLWTTATDCVALQGGASGWPEAAVLAALRSDLSLREFDSKQALPNVDILLYCTKIKI